jgi:hypothetical protein
MASTAHPDLGRRLRLAVAGAAVATVLTAATAGAAAAVPMGVQAAGLSRLDAGDSGSGLDARLRTRSDSGSGPRSPFPGFLLDRGRYTSFDAPGVPMTLARDLNNRGQIAGSTVAPPRPTPWPGPAGSCWLRASTARSPRLE